MSLYSTFIAIFIAGALGGVFNALLADNGWLFPRKVTTERGTIMQPGFIGNILSGAVAAVISWGLYSPIASVPLTQIPTNSLTPAAICGAMLVGVAGAHWLTNEVDKRLLKEAVSEAAKAQPSTELSDQIARTTSASRIYQLTKRMPEM